MAATAEHFVDGSDSGSTEDDELDFNGPRFLPFKDVITRRRRFFKELVQWWDVEDRNRFRSASGKPVKRVNSPTASMMPYLVLHPAIYRFMEPLCGLDKVAEHLKVVGWRQEVARLWPHCEGAFNAFVNSGVNASEDSVQTRLHNLIYEISKQLPRKCVTDERKFATVRGTLMRAQYEIRGIPDILYSSDGRFVLSAEVKTSRSFPDEDVWYRGSRGAQLLQALYTYNCPALLVTPTQFKVFVENKERNRVYTFPSKPSDTTASAEDRFWDLTICQPTKADLFKILVIILMQAEPACATVPSEIPDDAAGLGVEMRSTKSTPRKLASTQRSSTSGSSAANGQQTADGQETADGQDTINPQYMTGEHDASGQPVYCTVFVSPPSADPKVFSTSSEDDDIFARVDSAVAL